MTHELSTPAIVIAKQQLGDADLIVTLLSKDLGKIKAVCKSARKSTKRFLGGVDLFDCGVFKLLHPRGSSELYKIIELQNRQMWQDLRTDLTSFSLAVFALDLCCVFCHEGDSDSNALFNALYHTLSKLSSQTPAPIRCAVVMFFFFYILSLAGFSPLEHETITNPELKSFFQLLADTNEPALPKNLSLLKDGYLALLSIAEEAIGHRLRTNTDLLLTIQNIL